MGLFCLVLFASSCTLEQDIHFNKDWSGNAKYTLDLSAMTQLMGNDSVETENPLNSIKESFMTMKEGIEKSIGISNVSLQNDEDQGIYSILFDFTTVEALNNCLKGNGNSNNMFKNKKHVFFQQKGKNKLLFEAPSMNSVKKESEFKAEDLGNMAYLIKYNIKFSFDRKIKKINSKLNSKKGYQTANIELTIDQLMKDDFDGIMEITLAK